MLVFNAIGDAYGAAFEFVEEKDWPHENDAADYYQHPVISLGGGKYTDDTQMSLAVLELLLGTSDRGLKNLTKGDFIVEFYNAYKRDPRAGYSSGLTKLFEESKTVGEFSERLGGNSTRSGAVMRSAVVGMLPDVEDVMRISAIQCSATHDHPISIQQSQIVSLATHYLIHNGRRRENVYSYISDKLNIGYPIDRNKWEWASMEAVDCTRNAFIAWEKARNASDVLKRSVEKGGDTDTVATIAMGLAWADKSIANDLPMELINNLESGVYGFPHLQSVSALAYKRFIG